MVESHGNSPALETVRLDIQRRSRWGPTSDGIVDSGLSPLSPGRQLILLVRGLGDVGQWRLDEGVLA